MTRSRNAQAPVATDVAEAPVATAPDQPTATPTLTEEIVVTVPTESTLPVAATAPVVNVTWTDTPSVSAAYRAADQSGKASLRKGADHALRAAVMSGDLVAAQAIMATQAAMVTKAPEKAPVDYASLVKARVITLLRAAQFTYVSPNLIPGAPDDLSVDFFDGDAADDLHALNRVVAHLINDLDDDAVAKINSAATDLHTAKITTGTKAPKRDVSAHLGAVAAEMTADGNGSRFASVAALAKIKTDVYGDDLPSTGAVAAALGRDTFNVNGVTPVTKGSTLPNGTTAPSDGAWVTSV